MTEQSAGVEFVSIGLGGVRFESLFETIPLSIAIFDADLRLTSANSRYRELTGVDAPTSARLSIYDAFPNALADLTEQIDAAVRGVTGRAAERVPFHFRNGRRLIETTFTAVGEEAGGRSILFAGSDVSEREELRETLGRSVAQLESIFDVIPDSVRVVDIDGRTVRSNTQALQDHAGAASQPSTLRELWQLDRPRTMEGTSLFMHEHPTARALRGERVRGETLSVRRGVEGASVIIEVNSNPLYDEQGKIRGAVTVERDVTAKTHLAKALEEEARRTAELFERVSTEAERLERMVQERTAELLALQEARARERRLAAVGQLAAGVMHDVNNALNPIMAAAYLLETNADNPAAVRDYAVRIAKAAETGAATAARVGRFIRQEPMQSEREEIVDLSLVCDEVVAMTRPLWAERARGGTVKLQRDLGRGARHPRPRRRDSRGVAQPRAELARRHASRRHARLADVIRRRRGASRGERLRNGNVLGDSRARVRAVLHDERARGNRTRPRRGLWNREAAPRPSGDRLGVGAGNDDQPDLPRRVVAGGGIHGGLGR